MKNFWVLVSLSLFFMGVAMAEVSINTPGYGVRIQSDTGTEISTHSERIGPDVQIDGVTIINDEVFIDGEKIPKGKTVYTSKRSKKTYLIQWGKNGNVSVSEK